MMFGYSTFKGDISLEENEEDPTQAIITDVYVNPRHRGEGVGTILVRWAIEKAKEEGFASISLYAYSTDNSVAQELLIDWYAGFGFKEEAPGEMTLRF